MRHWIDEAAGLGAFNVFCIGDDTRTAQGHIFEGRGINPKLSDFFFRTVSYAHKRGFVAAVEPVGLPPKREEEHFKRWLQTWIGPGVPVESQVDIIKLSLEWFGAYSYNPDIATEVASFLQACRKINPHVLIYIDSIGGVWRRPQPFHRWLLSRFPGTIISHYLNTEQVEAFGAQGARNVTVQINPSESAETGGQFFIYHDKTVHFLKDVVKKRVRYLSLAGVNFGYSRYNYDLFLEVIRPHLKLARDLQELTAAIVPDRIAKPATEQEVRAWLLGKQKEKRLADPPVPLNPAGRPLCTGSASLGCRVRPLAALADGKIGPRFSGAYTDPCRKVPVEAVFTMDFGRPRTLSRVRVVPCLHPSEKAYLATEFKVQLREKGCWRTIPGGGVKGNTKPELLFKFPQTEADPVRLVILSETDDGKGNYRVCCQELAAQ